MTKIAPEESVSNPNNDKKHLYFPLQVESEEEITLKAIESKPLNEDKESIVPANKGVPVYFKYAMLIGLCKRRRLIISLIIND